MPNIKTKKLIGQPRYWVCIIGPVPSLDLPDGSDFGPRVAARQQILNITGHDPECISGWFGTEEYKQIIKHQYSRS